MEKMKFALCFVVCALIASHTFALDASITKLLQSAGAVTYAVKDPYGSGIQKMILGYDADNQPIIGVAERETKTYKKVTTVVAVVPDGDAFKISVAEVPDIQSLPGKSKSYTQEALRDITGRVFPGAEEAKGLVDAVTGATKYYKAIYISYSLMAHKIIEEMQADPDWERTPLP